VLLAGCGDRQAPAVDTPAAAPAAPRDDAPKAVPKRKPNGRVSAEDIARIEATGRSGLWSDIATACATGAPQRATLTWNVKDSGADKVVLYVVGRDGRERHFGRGGAVGERLTGPWLRPGLAFKLRQAGTKAELGEVVIGDKQCR
jgi:hypothetical protein